MHVMSSEQLQGRMRKCEFDCWLGLTVLSFDDAGLAVRIPYRREMEGNPVTRTMHGGILSAIVDAVGCYHMIGAYGYSVATIDLLVDYLRPAHGELVARTHLIKHGRKVSVVEVKVFDSADRPVASGRITCTPLAKIDDVDYGLADRSP